jgi:exodeoxyribonuclease-1
MIYDGFFSHKDALAFEKIRNSTEDQLGKIKLNVSDPRFKELFFRYRARNFPHSLTDDEQKKWNEYRKAIFDEKKDEYFVRLESYLNEFQSEKYKYDALKGLSDYVQSITENT